MPAARRPTLGRQVRELIGSADAACEPAEQGTARSSKSASCDQAELSTAPADIARTGARIWLSHSPDYKIDEPCRLARHARETAAFRMPALASVAPNDQRSVIWPMTLDPVRPNARALVIPDHASAARHIVVQHVVNVAADSSLAQLADHRDRGTGGGQ